MKGLIYYEFIAGRDNNEGRRNAHKEEIQDICAFPEGSQNFEKQRLSART